MFNDFDLGSMTAQTLNIVPVMEQAAAPLTDPADAPRALRAALDQLTKQ